jgi:hypothetical protein
MFPQLFQAGLDRSLRQVQTAGLFRASIRVIAGAVGQAQLCGIVWKCNCDYMVPEPVTTIHEGELHSRAECFVPQ